MTAFRKIAVRGPNWLGDHVMALPFYQAIANSHPDHHRVLYVPNALRDLPVEGLFHEVIGLDLVERKTFAGMRHVATYISIAKYDKVWILPTSFRAAFPFALAGVPRRIGLQTWANQWLLHEGKKWLGVEAKKHKTDLYLELLNLRDETPRSTILRSDEKRIVIAPGASIELREWPYFSQLIGKLAVRYPEHEIAVVGGRYDVRVAEMVKPLLSPQVKTYIGQTTLADLLALIRRSQLVVANDSGIAHVAATMAQVPTVVLMGPGAPHYITPRGPSVKVIRDASLACSPCESAKCKAPFGYQECLKRLSVDQVFAQVESLL